MYSKKAILELIGWETDKIGSVGVLKIGFFRANLTIPQDYFFFKYSSRKIVLPGVREEVLGGLSRVRNWEHWDGNAKVHLRFLLAATLESLGNDFRASAEMNHWHKRHENVHYGHIYVFHFFASK